MGASESYHNEIQVFIIGSMWSSKILYVHHRFYILFDILNLDLDLSWATFGSPGMSVAGPVENLEPISGKGVSVGVLELTAQALASPEIGFSQG